MFNRRSKRGEQRIEVGAVAPCGVRDRHGATATAIDAKAVEHVDRRGIPARRAR